MVFQRPRPPAASWSRAIVALATFVGAIVAVAPDSRPVEAAPILDLVSVVPARLLETRIGPTSTTIDGVAEGIGRRAAGSTIELLVAGRGGVPESATAAFLNVTAIAPSSDGFLTVYPCGEDRPLASNVNYAAGDVVPNAVLAQIGVGGKVCVYTLASTDAVVDVNGFVPLGGSPEGVNPSRILETRDEPGQTTVDGDFEAIGRRGAGTTIELQVAGRGGVPGDADGVFLNLTAIGPDTAGFLTVYPCNEQRPLASNVNYVQGDVVPNAVLAKLDPVGKVCIYTLAGTHMIADVNGFVPKGRTPGTVVPARILETRIGADFQTVDDLFEGIGKQPAGATVELQVAGRGGVPDGASAVFLNVTAVEPEDFGFVTVYPCGEDRPLTSNVNYAPGDVSPNSVLAKIGDGGKVCIYTLAASHLLVDVAGEVPQPSVKGLVEVSVGNAHACALDDEGGVTCWGQFIDGQLGIDGIDGGPSNSVLPVTIPDFAASQVETGEYFTCALEVDATVSCWGRNTFGQIGDGTVVAQRSTPTAVSGLTGVVEITVGRRHACALRNDDSVWCWGTNGAGQLGDGTKDDSATAVQVIGFPAGRTVVSIDAGHSHTCAVMDDGSATCWGGNSVGQIGYVGPTTTTPVAVVGLTGAVEIGAGQNHTCARLQGGTVQCWGASNELGNGGGAGSTSVPQTVAGLTGVVGISVGFTTTCAARGDGTAACWGDNASGEVGNGVVGGPDETTPNTVVGIDGSVRSVDNSEGGRFTCAALADTSVVCFGTNFDKELGSLTDGRQPSAVPLVVGSSGLG